MPVAQLKATLNKNEYYGWIQYFNFKPPEVAEIQMATLISVAVNAMSKAKTKTEDFIISKTAVKGKENKYESRGYNPVDETDMGDYLKPL